MGGQGETEETEPWQLFITGCLFGWKRKDGSRRFRMAYCELPRKNGKSTLAAAIGLYLAFADGEAGAEVYTAATKRDQARIVHSEAIRMVKKSPELRGVIKIHRDSLTMPLNESRYIPLGADADTLDGLNVSGAIVDELHAHKTRALLDVLDTATGSRRQPLIFIITTAGFDKLSVCWSCHENAESVLRGTVEQDDFFAFIATTDPGDSWEEAESWAKANPNFGISVKADDLARKAKRAKTLPSALNNFLRLHLNVWTEQETRWLQMEWWAKGSAPKIVWDRMRGRRCFGGLDLATRIDLAALVLAFPLGARVALKPYFWIPSEVAEERERDQHLTYRLWAERGFVEITDGAVIDLEYIQERIKEESLIYQIEHVCYDPWNATQLAVNVAASGTKMIEFAQTLRNFNEPAKLFESLLREQKVLHNGNPVLAWQAENVEVITDRSGNIRPVKPEHGSRKKVDGIVAGVMAVSGLISDPGESVYESRGIEVI